MAILTTASNGSTRAPAPAPDGVTLAPPTIRIILPLPPSANALFTNVPGRGRVRTKAYRAWAREAGWICQAARLPKITGPYRFKLYAPVNARADIDNYSKGVIDLFVSLGLTPDDRHAVSVSAERHPAVAKMECLVVIEADEAVREGVPS